MPSLSVIRFQPLRSAQLQLLAFDDAGTGDEEEGLVEPDIASEQLHARALAEGVDDRHRLPNRQGRIRWPKSGGNGSPA